MSMITSSEYGMVSVNNSVLSKLIIDNMTSMGKVLVPCNKRGKVLRKSFFVGVNEMLNAVEISQTSEGYVVKVYFILLGNSKYEDVSNDLFDMIDQDFELLSLKHPVRLIANVKGSISDQILNKMDVELVRQDVR